MSQTYSSHCYGLRFQSWIKKLLTYLLTYLSEMSTWWPENRKCILGNQRKVVCPILILPITSNRHFRRLLSYFHGHLTWIYCWYSFLMATYTRNAIWLTCRLRKWVEVNGLKVWHRNVRRSSRTYRFSYHLITIVLFIAVARACTK